MYFYIKFLEQGHQCDQNKPNNKLSFFSQKYFFTQLYHFECRKFNCYQSNGISLLTR